MNYYKNGKSIIATIGKLDLPEITKEEYDALNEAMAIPEVETEPMPAQEERLEALEAAILELAEVMCNG